MSSTPTDETLDYKQYPILLVDDEQEILRTFALNYKQLFDIRSTTSGKEALEIIEHEPIAVLITDQRMPEMTGVELIRRALEVSPGLIPIILTGYTDVEALVTAINIGRIYRYVPKPWDRGELRETICRALESHHLVRTNAGLLAENSRLFAELERANERLRQENRYLKQQQSEGTGFDTIVGKSPALTRVVDLARRVADSTTTVLIEGPTGSGKELIARAIHDASPRAGRLFVAVNTGTMTETLLASTLFGHRRGAFTGANTDQKGLFEIANGGTLFLDEIGETTPALQVHLLRVLQEGEIQPLGATRPIKVDVRIVAATNRKLEAEVKAGRFREDLLHRLRVFPLRLPALRERREDIPILAEHIARRLEMKTQKRIAGIDPEALAALSNHTFPGNVRELENMIERALLVCEPGGYITEEELFERWREPGADAGIDGADTLAARVIKFEREQIDDVLGQHHGNKSAAARRLGLTYRGLLKKMQRYGMIPSGADAEAAEEPES